VDEPPQNAPTYIGTSTLGIEILTLVEEAVDTVRGRILWLVKGQEGQQKNNMIVGTASVDGAPHSAHSSAVGETRMTEEVERPEAEERQKDQEKVELEEKQKDHEVVDEQLTEELSRKLREANQEGKMLKEDMPRLQERKRKLMEEMQCLAELNEALERQMMEVQHDNDNRKDEPKPEVQHDDDNGKDESEPEVRVEVKGKKRSKSGGSGKPRKVAKTDAIRRSSRARLPSKKAMKS
jgi:hypothetical protein